MPVMEVAEVLETLGHPQVTHTAPFFDLFHMEVAACLLLEVVSLSWQLANQLL